MTVVNRSWRPVAVGARRFVLRDFVRQVLGAS